MSSVSQKDLVLNPSTHVNPDKWDETKYHLFADELCGGREYQKEAIFAVLRFLLSGNYQNLRELAQENHDANPSLQEFYGSWKAMESRLQLPDMLSCSVDLATGTGKSYVLYGIAAIMLAEGAVDRVLLLCPSLTIESGLTEKFRLLAGSSHLRELMPKRAKCVAPRIVDASVTAEEGCICVENYHAVLEHAQSSIHDSFVGRGGDALVLNDEAHHVASESQNKRGKWKEFLMNSDYGFRRVVGVSGTCYVGNDYFTDVVSRYSLRQAIEKQVVKNVRYVVDAPRLHDPDEKWQVFYQTHSENRRKQRPHGIRPLSIVVTQKINGCESVAAELRAFLCEEEGISEAEADKKVLVVTSSPKHCRNILELRNVDSSQSNVEWIVSVSMLSEGWDVKNVFQIVPHEERAFNSKLLIAQVLGRGLRVPDSWSDSQPVVTVSNHQAWSASIRRLVKEILEIEQRVSSVVIADPDFHFDLHNLKYSRHAKEAAHSMSGEDNPFEKGIPLPTANPEEEGSVEYESVHGKGGEQSVTIRHKSYTAPDVAEHMWNHLRAIDTENELQEDARRRTNYAKRYPLADLESLVRESVRDAGINENEIPDQTRQQLLKSLNALKRRESKRVTYTTVAEAMSTISTRDRQPDSCSALELRGAKKIFCRSDCAKFLPQDQREFFSQLNDPDGDYSGSVAIMGNDFLFKSPVNLAIADHAPERRFIRQLCLLHNAELVVGWIKNTNVGFYAIEYAWGTGHRLYRTSHIRRSMFSPDFFIKMQGGRVLVVEIKEDSEIRNLSNENIGKFRSAQEHFHALNEWLEKEGNAVRYQFNMLTPRNYAGFFSSWRKRNVESYRSELDAEILRVSSMDDD